MWTVCVGVWGAKGNPEEIIRIDPLVPQAPTRNYKKDIIRPRRPKEVTLGDQRETTWHKKMANGSS